MKIETWVFSSGVFFFTPIGIVYGFVTRWHEPVGVVAILLTAGLSFLIGLYLLITSRRIDNRPEDDPFGNINQGAGELGTFSPRSWWPLPVAGGLALAFAGLAVGWWLFYIGGVVTALAAVGFVFEYYRGAHAH